MGKGSGWRVKNGEYTGSKHWCTHGKMKDKCKECKDDKNKVRRR